MNVRKKAGLPAALLALILLLSACGGGSEEVYGKIAKISGDRIIVDNGTYSPADGTEGANFSFQSDGSQSSYSLGEEIDTMSLPEDAIVRLTLSNQIVTAVETLQTAETSEPQPETSKESPSDLPEVYVVDGRKKTASNGAHHSTPTDIDTIVVKNKGTFHMRGGTLTKSEAPSDKKTSGRSPRRHNALFTASGGSSATLDSTQVTSSGNGANAIFATGKHTKIDATSFDIYTSGRFSNGLEATQGGEICASEGAILTKGAHSAPLSIGSANGTIQISDTEIRSSGQLSPCIFSSGTVTASSLTGTASASPIAIIDSGGKLILEDCLLLGSGEHGFLFQPQTSASKPKKTVLKARNSKLTSTAKGAMFYISGLKVSAVLENTSLYHENDILTDLRENSSCTLKAINQRLQGMIKCGPQSSVVLKLTKGSVFKGAFDTDAGAASASIALDGDSRWSMTDDSHVYTISNRDASCRNIKSNGHTIYYNASHPANSWLKGKTISLPGGGKLTPDN